MYSCGYCGSDISNLDEAASIWVGDQSFQDERMAFFCNEDCIAKWWESPEDEDFPERFKRGE